MTELEIIRGEEFKIKVYPQITKDNIFWKEYRKAASLLCEIVTASVQSNKQGKQSWKFEDYENNIIAFCGDRGEGKSSATFSFARSIAHQKNDSELYRDSSILKEITFSDPIIIDPSMFDEVHNILDIVLAHLYKCFTRKANKEDNDCVNIRERDNMIDRFQKVYRYVSLIANQEKMLDDEYDYEGNIGKLSKLGESTQIKAELTELIADYLKYVEGVERDKGQLVIAIDDLDLCSANAYKMAEQIRKYLIIPNVVILMSVRVEQLLLCVEEKNLSDFSQLFGSSDRLHDEMTDEIRTMSEKYINKLIPLKRRIYLPRIQAIQNVHIVYKDNSSDKVIWSSTEDESLVKAVLKLIRQKTGMHFLATEGNISYLLPDNMRAMINWITMLAEMKDADTEDEYIENIDTFYNYYMKELENGLTWKYKADIQNIECMNAGQMFNTINAIIIDIMDIKQQNNNVQNNYTGQILMENAHSLCNLTNWFVSNVYTVQTNSRALNIYMLQTLYTIKLNKLKAQCKEGGRDNEWTSFIGGYIWGWGFSNILPAIMSSSIDRSRFQIGTARSYNIIFQHITNQVENSDILKEEAKVSRINKLEDRFNYIYAWIVLGMLGNVYYTNNFNEILSYQGTFIYENSVLLNYIHISLENYLFALGNLQYIYDKVNMEMLGVTKEDFLKYVEILTEKNKKSIDAVKIILSNMDIMVGLKNYILENRRIKYSAQDEICRTAQIADGLFNNIATYLRKMDIDISANDFKYLNLEDTVDNNTVDISMLFGELLNESLTNQNITQQRMENEEDQRRLEEFRNKLVHMTKVYDKKWYSVAAFLKNKSVQNALVNMDYLAKNIQRYIGLKKEVPDFVNINALCGFYGQLLEYKSQNGEMAELSEELLQAYKNVAKLNRGIIS